jgi:hypothetical protein
MPSLRVRATLLLPFAPSSAGPPFSDIWLAVRYSFVNPSTAMVPDALSRMLKNLGREWFFIPAKA